MEVAEEINANIRVMEEAQEILDAGAAPFISPGRRLLFHRPLLLRVDDPGVVGFLFNDALIVARSDVSGGSGGSSGGGGGGGGGSSSGGVSAARRAGSSASVGGTTSSTAAPGRTSRRGSAVIGEDLAAPVMLVDIALVDVTSVSAGAHPLAVDIATLATKYSFFAASTEDQAAWIAAVTDAACRAESTRLPGLAADARNDTAAAGGVISDEDAAMFSTSDAGLGETPEQVQLSLSGMLLAHLDDDVWTHTGTPLLREWT